MAMLCLNAVFAEQKVLSCNLDTERNGTIVLLCGSGYVGHGRFDVQVEIEVRWFTVSTKTERIASVARIGN